MTTQQRKAVASGVLTTVVAGVVLFGVSRAWDSKADRATVEQALNSARQERDALRSVMQRVDERTARMERYLCRGRPEDIGC